MRTIVSRGTLYDDQGRRLCVRCGRRPARVSPSRVQSYCRECYSADARERRRGMVQVLLTPEEWAGIKLARVLGQPVGRHHRGEA